MNPDQIRARLLADRKFLEERLQRTHQHLYGRDEPVSPKFSEQVVESGNDSLIQTLDEEGQAELRQIQRALARLEAGDYEDCSHCGQPIGEPRLQALPHTDLCITCASAA